MDTLARISKVGLGLALTWSLHARADVATVGTVAAAATTKALPPVDRRLLPPAEQRWASAEDVDRHRRIMDELWQTTLAQMYLAYLTDDSPDAMVPGRARQLVQQIYAEGQHAGKRLKLIVHLISDLYARRQMNEEMVKRMLIFDTLALSYKLEGEDTGNAQMFTYALVALVASIPLASEPFAKEFKNLRELISRRCVGGQCQHVIDWSKFWDVHGIVRSYDPWSHFTGLLGVGGGGLFLYGLTKQQMPGFLRRYDKDEKMLDGRDALIEQAEY